jgi:hypothetical protein
LFVRAAESGTLQLTAELIPAVRGRAWTAALQLQNWDVAQGPPQFQLADGAPSGMTLDPRDGTLSWTPPEEFALGTLDVRVAVLGRDPQSPVIETNCRSTPTEQPAATRNSRVGRCLARTSVGVRSPGS